MDPLSGRLTDGDETADAARTSPGLLVHSPPGPLCRPRGKPLPLRASSRPKPKILMYFGSVGKRNFVDWRRAEPAATSSFRIARMATPERRKAYSARRLTAFGPFPMRSGSTSKLTFCPSMRVRRPDASIAEMWTNTSFAPPSGVMKPKPLVELKNFTVPVCDFGITPSPVALLVPPAPGGPAVVDVFLAAHNKNPPPRRGRQRFTASGKGSIKRSSLRVSKCPNGQNIARKAKACKTRLP